MDRQFAVAAQTVGPEMRAGAQEDSMPVEVSAVIPCLNEAESLAICIEKAHSGFAAMGVRGEVVVSDNGSVDDSVAIAKRSNSRVVHEAKKGYGAALTRGILEARGKIIVMGDADDSYDWSAIAPFVMKVREGNDLVVGNRFRGGIMHGAMPPLHRYLGKPVLSCIGRIVFRTNIGDFHCGMRAFTKSAFQRMGITSSGMEFATEMIANSACLGLRIAEVPTKLYPDKRNRPPHLRSFRDGWRHLRFILTYAPNYLYVIPGISLFLFGLLSQFVLNGGPIVLGGFSFGATTLAVCSLLTPVGFNLVIFGVLAKALMAQRYAGLNTRILGWIRSRFTLEAGLTVGGLLASLGVVIDIALKLWPEALRVTESAFHLSFIATTTLVLGINLMFSAFLLHMIFIVSSESKWIGPNENSHPRSAPRAMSLKNTDPSD